MSIDDQGLLAAVEGGAEASESAFAHARGDPEPMGPALAADAGPGEALRGSCTPPR